MTDAGAGMGDIEGTAGPGDLPSAGRVLDVRYSLRARDLLEPGAAGSRHSMITALFGFFLVFGSVFPILMGDWTVIGFVLFAVGFVTGLIPGAIMAFMAGRRPDLLSLEQRVVIDGEGVRMASERATSTSTWSLFKRVRETRTAFLLDFGTGAATFVPKRALDAREQATLVAIAMDAGKMDHRSSWYWPAVGVGLGVIVTVILLALTL